MNRKDVLRAGILHGKKRSSGWVDFHCPFCNDRRKVFGYNISADYFKCFKCGVNGRLSDLDSFDIENDSKCSLDLKYIKQKILLYRSENEGVKNTPICDYNEKHLVTPVTFYDHVSPLYESNSRVDLRMQEYLSGRGIVGTDVKKIVFTSADGDFLPNRLIFPIHNSKNKLVGYQARHYRDDAKPKVINPPCTREERNGFVHDGWKSTSDLVYAPFGFRREMFICEGIFDYLSMWEMGYPAVSLLKCQPNSRQLNILTGNGVREIVVALDADLDTEKLINVYKTLLLYFDPKRVWFVDWTKLVYKFGLPIKADPNDLLLSSAFRNRSLGRFVSGADYIYRKIS